MADAVPSSRIPGFYRLSLAERLARVADFSGLSQSDAALLQDASALSLGQADRMIENVAGRFPFPLGFAANFRLNGRDLLVPMVIEEPSVVAAASNAARLMRGGEGIRAEATAPIMIGQVQICDVPDMAAARSAIDEARPELLERMDALVPRLVRRGGGARGLDLRVLPETPAGPMLIVGLLLDVRDAMGANLVNHVAEGLAPRLAELSGGVVNLRILSNLADRRLIKTEGRIPIRALGRDELGYTGLEVAQRIVSASAFAECDPYRAATHNKGFMNGLDAVLVATGQDWRAVEAGAHAYAARDGQYRAMSWWRIEGDELVGRAEIPMQVGVVGGVVQVHPVVKVLLRILDVGSADELGCIAVAVGLAQNLAAIMALATEGIQRGHMSLHARNLAASVGARGHEIDWVVEQMVANGTFSQQAARSIFQQAPWKADGPLRSDWAVGQPPARG